VTDGSTGREVELIVGVIHGVGVVVSMRVPTVFIAMRSGVVMGMVCVILERLVSMAVIERYGGQVGRIK
jgi:hypothetical protein